MKLKNLVFAFVAFSFSAVVWAGAYDELTPEEQQKLQRGEQVLRVQDASNGWPVVTAYQRMDATPEESMAVLFDVNRHKNFFPNMKDSKVIARPSTRVIEALYTISLPFPFSSEKDTVRLSFEKPSKADEHALKWALLKGKMVKKFDAHVRIEPLGNATILALYMEIVISTGVADGQAKKEIPGMVSKIAQKYQNKVLHERLSERELLDQQLDEYRRAVGR